MGRRFITFSSAFFFLWPLAVLLGHHRATAAQNAPPPVQVPVGVILNKASAAGMRWRTGVRMAVDDYYAAHPSSATRVELHFSDSPGDAVGAASAAVGLIKNAQVQAIIIGPETSAEAEFVAAIGSRAHVPVLSSSAAPSPSHASFFVRTAADDSSQAAPVAAVLGAFAWRAVVLVHEDSPRHGTGFPLALADALRGFGARVVDRAAVPAGATDDRLDAALYRLMAMPTRVFAVHVSPPLAARLFHRARRAGMMAEGYAWLATAGVGSAMSASPQDIDAMEGVVGVRPYVRATSQARSFSARFNARFRRENPGARDIHEPAVPTLWAYDTAWAVAAAVEAAGITGTAFHTPQGSTALTELDRLGVSATGTALLRAVLNTTFDGLAGEFRLVDGQMKQQPAYEIVNVVGKGTATVGFWTPESALSQDSNSGGGGGGGKGLKQIVWPGEPSSGRARAPRGWAVSPNVPQLQIAVPMKNGFSQFVRVSNESTTGRPPKVTGYCIDVFDAVMKALPYPVNYQYVPFNGSSVSYDELVRQVVDQTADGVVGDVAITSSRMGEVDFTMPFTESGWSMVVTVRARTSTSMFFFLRPLTASLWLASFVFFVFTGFVVWVIEHRVNPEFRGTPSQQFGLIFYYAFSTLVFAHREKLESNLSRFVVIIWVFVVLILTSSYTASLTSMLTVQNLEPTVTDVKELIRRGDYVGYQEGSFVPRELKEMSFDESKLRSYSTPEQYADALSRGSANGGVAAVFDEVPYLELFLSQYCDGYAMVGPTYKVAGFGFIFPKGSAMVPDVSRGIVALTEGDEMARIERKWLGEPGACDSQSSGGGGGGVGSSSLSFWSFGGLFLVTGVASGLMLAVYVVTFFYRERHQLRAAESGGSRGEGGSASLRRLRAWLQHYDTKDTRCPSFNTLNNEPVRNGGSDGKTARSAKGGADQAVSQTSGADGSEMDAASLPGEDEETHEFSRIPFEQRAAEEAAASAERHGPPAAEAKPPLRFLLGSEERKEDQSASP